jgi:hypothetical protein
MKISEELKDLMIAAASLLVAFLLSMMLKLSEF